MVVIKTVNGTYHVNTFLKDTADAFGTMAKNQIEKGIPEALLAVEFRDVRTNREVIVYLNKIVSLEVFNENE